MLDKHSIKLIRPIIECSAQALRNRGISANQITLVGFFIGLLALPALVWQQYYLALLCILLNRLLDGIDGQLARKHGITDSGGFLDICCDFIFYPLVPLGFILANPTDNAISGALLIFTFIGTGSSFLAFAIMAEKYQLTDATHGKKSFAYLGGLTEGTETIVCFVLFCLLPEYFPMLAFVFALLCLLTTATRLYGGFLTIKHAEMLTHSTDQQKDQRLIK